MTKTKTKILSAVAVVFLCFWATGFSSSLLSSHCLKPKLDIQKKIAACNFASATTLSRYFEADHPEYAALEFERAIALAEGGDSQKAHIVMRDLLEWASIDKTSQATGNRRDDRVADEVFSGARRLDRNSVAFWVFAQAMGFDGV